MIVKYTSQFLHALWLVYLSGGILIYGHLKDITEPQKLNILSVDPRFSPSDYDWRASIRAWTINRKGENSAHNL